MTNIPGRGGMSDALMKSGEAHKAEEDKMERYQPQVSDITKQHLEALLIIADRSDAVDRPALKEAREHFYKLALRSDRHDKWKQELSDTLAKVDRETWRKIWVKYDT